MNIDYGVPCDSEGMATYCLEVNGEVVDATCDIYGQQTYNPCLVIDYKKGKEWYDVMAGDVVSISVIMC